MQPAESANPPRAEGRNGGERSFGELHLSLILLGAGLALLGAAYLHDVWYC